MKEITILSGKGGTGKTSIACALASVAENAVFCDNDVDASDLHIIFRPEIKKENSFSGGRNVNIDNKRCTGCGICFGYCRFDAIHYSPKRKLIINPFKCEGCRLCERICPSQAISSEIKKNNFWYISETRFGTLVHAKMEPGEENSGKLVTEVRKSAREIAIKHNREFIINDGPPGIGCATIASLSGVNIVLIVIEPTKSGLNDLKRLVELIESFKIKSFAVINKTDINHDISLEMETYLLSRSIPVQAKIPFDKKMVLAMLEGKTILEYDPDSYISKKICDVWQKLKSQTLS